MEATIYTPKKNGVNKLCLFYLLLMNLYANIYDYFYYTKTFL